MKKSYFVLDGRSPAAVASVCLMLLCGLLRTFYYVRAAVTPFVFWVYYVNVAAASLLFLVFVLFFGNRFPELTLLPLAMGVFFFVVKALTFEDTLHTILCVLLYLSVPVLYALTLYGKIRKLLFLHLLFGLPLLVHIGMDLQELFTLDRTLFEWLPELSVLAIMAALFALSFAFRKREDMPEIGRAHV